MNKVKNKFRGVPITTVLNVLLACMDTVAGTDVALNAVVMRCVMLWVLLCQLMLM